MNIGVGELAGSVIAIIGAGWVLLQLAFRQFEKRLDDKFDAQSREISAQSAKISVLEQISNEVKRLELENIRVESRSNITFATKEELIRAIEKNEKTIERVFNVLQKIDEKIEGKIDRDDCERMMRSVARSAQ